jgi:CelD/BcsL family acetyltransferase involved in cellulose biosynthesis
MCLFRLKSDEESVAPACLVVRRGHEVIALVIGTILTRPLDFKVGYVPIGSAHTRVLAVPDHGFLGRQDPSVARAVVRALVELLKGGVAELAHLACVGSDSALREAVTEVASGWCRGRLEFLEDRWSLTLGKDFDAFLASRSKNTRGQIRRHERRFLEAHASVRMVNVGQQLGSVDRILVDALPDVKAVLQTTYQFRLGLTPLCRGSAEEELALLGRLGRLALTVVYVGERPVAFSYAHIYKGTAVFGTPGYDPAFAAFHAGEYALVQLIRVLFARGDVTALDYGLGYSQYKEAFGSSLAREGHLRIFAPTPRGLLLNCARTGTSAANQSLRGLARGLGLTAKLKRLLRKGPTQHRAPR